MADHTTFATFYGEHLPRVFFEPNDAVIINNPHLLWGYCHGTITDPNPGWKPTAWHAEVAANNHRHQIKASGLEGAANQPPNPRLVLSKINILVCPVVEINPTHQCGMTFESQPDFRRHLRNVRSGCFINPDRRPIRREERQWANPQLIRYSAIGLTIWNGFHAMTDHGGSSMAVASIAPRSPSLQPAEGVLDVAAKTLQVTRSFSRALRKRP
ncbi:hypothetical protein N7532_007233 [Penicillium argentinense]|uniref:Uncharacterized protein n=1 Tax=Penicillium argentinense TaxID=1131581 RepID=A0A9W9F7I8_9EURO|nr:uncharacterized protein N7532_007233 [Penicillium argentinense]KAJ5094942.1 hypothetical protein N7532_007233 [Penicillium argentinense]